MGELNDIYAGRNPVREALRAGIAFDTVYILREAESALAPIIDAMRRGGATVKQVPEQKLSALAGGASHQGVVAIASSVAAAELKDIFLRAKERGEPPFILIADEIEDPHNLGALIRSAECAGAHGVIVPRHRSAVLGGVVAKSSAGAVAHIPVAKVPNLVAAMKELKDKGVWIYGADQDGEDYTRVDLGGPAAIVIGSEGKGLGRLVRENCDVLVSIEMRGKINSLNASVAGGVLLFAAAGARRQK